MRVRRCAYSSLNNIKIVPCCIPSSDLQFEDVNGNQLREVFPVRSRQLRPAPPEGCQQQSLDDYEVRRQRPAARVACQQGCEPLHLGTLQRRSENRSRMVAVCRCSNAGMSGACADSLWTLFALQVGQAVDYKETDIWWHGVVWAKAPGQLTIYLPGQRSTLPLIHMQPQAQAWGTCTTTLTIGRRIGDCNAEPSRVV